MVLQENYETDIDVMLVNIGRKRLLKVFEVANSDHSNLKVGKHDHYCAAPAAAPVAVA